MKANKTILLVLILFSFYKAPIMAFQAHNNDLRSLDSLKQKAKIVGYNGDWGTSVELYDLVIPAYERLGERERFLSATFDRALANVYREDISLEKRLGIIQRKIKATENTPLYVIYKSVFLCYLLSEESFDQFEMSSPSVISTLKEQENYILLHKLNSNISFIFYKIGDFENSELYHKRAETYLAKCSNTPEDEFLDMYNLKSALYYSIGKVDESLEGSLKSIGILEKYYHIDTIGLAYEYNNLASIYDILGDEDNAVLYYKKALETINNYAGYFPEIEKIGFISSVVFASASENDEQNIADCAKMIRLLEAHKGKDREQWEDLILAYNVISNYYLSAHKLDSALLYNEKSFASSRHNPILTCETYSIKCRIFISKNQLIKAEKAIKKAIELAIKQYGFNASLTTVYRNTLADCLLKREEYIGSLKLIQKCLQNITRTPIPNDWYSNPLITDVLDKNALVSSMQLKIQVLNALYKEKPDPKIIDAIYDCTKLATEALVEINRAFKNNGSKRRWLNQNAIPFFESAIGTALDLAKSTGKERYLAEAFQLSEQSKSMLMTDVLQEQQAVQLGGVPEELVREHTELEQLVATTEKERFDAHTAQDKAAEKMANDRLFEYKHQLDLLRHRFELEYPKYYKLKYSTTTITVEQVQTALQTGDYLIEYFEGKDHIYLFAIGRNSLQVEQMKRTATYNIRLKKFQQSLMNIRQFMQDPTTVYNTYVKDAYQLYQDLLAPLKLDNATRLLIVPDGQLSYLPFEVLLTEPRQPVANSTSQDANFGTLPYLLRQCPTNYLYSAQLWLQQLQRDRHINNGKILGFAPAYQGTTLPDWRQQREIELRENLQNLPGATEEVALLNKRYLGQYYLGQEASEARFKQEAADYSILHLAMHGLIDQSNPQYSGLALTEDQSKDEDNFLYAYEIKQLPLAADLVVLSACETGIGKYQRGEGVVSIGRSFIYAGAPALLMTLWSLNDQSGAFIIEQFYDNLSKGYPKDEAIRQAKLGYLDHFVPEYTHPFMWAAFVSVGDHRPIDIQTPTPYWWYALLGGLVLLVVGVVVFGVKHKR